MHKVTYRKFYFKMQSQRRIDMLNILKSFKNYTIRDVQNKIEEETLFKNTQGIRQNLRIAVIDDQPFLYLEALQSNNFDIASVGNINNVNQLERYDIIACDLRNVGMELNSKLQGASVIQEIKRLYPNKYIIAYSGSFDRSQMSKIASQTADKKINKSADLDKWIVTLDDAISSSVNPLAQWSRIRHRLVELNVSAEKVAKVENAFAKSIILKNKKYLENVFEKVGFSEDVRPVVQGLVSSAIWGMIASL